MRVLLYAPLRFNPSGYGHDVVALPDGVQDASDALAAFVAANPAVGKVLAALAAPSPSEPEAEDDGAAPDGPTIEAEDDDSSQDYATSHSQEDGARPALIEASEPDEPQPAKPKRGSRRRA